MELASSLIQVAVDIVANNVCCIIGLKEELTMLEHHLKHVECLLYDRKNLKDKQVYVKPALLALRQLHYEADDLIIDCKLRDEYNDGFFRSIRFSLSAGSNLKDINRRVVNQLEILDRFLKVKTELKEKIGEKVVSQYSYSPDVVIGLDEDIEKIKSWICKENAVKLHQIVVCGGGGSGKTTIVQKIYNHADVSNYFDTKIWVSVSSNFNKKEILKSMLAVLVGSGMLSQLRPSDYLGEIRIALERRKGCLVVIEDVGRITDVSWWRAMCATFDIPYKRNCIIATTRDVIVVKIHGDDDRIHMTKTLNKAESWQLFLKSANSRDRPGFREVGLKIVEKCRRLPQLIKLVGTMLATKDTLSEWSEVLNSLIGSYNVTGSDLAIEILRVSYNELDPHLQLCLLSFSLYPEDSEISANQVIHWWIAEGMLPKRKTKISIVELGHEYLSELTRCCLVEVGERRAYDGRVYSCRIQKIVREMVTMIAEEEGLCSFNEQGVMNRKARDPYWLCLTDDVINERDRSRYEDYGFISNGGRRKCLFDKNSKIRALLLMINHEDEINLSKNSEILPSLRMLDLSAGSINLLGQKSLKKLMGWISLLKRLACLNLTGLTNLELPSSICELRNLQVLVLIRCCNLKNLPDKIGKLKSLIGLYLPGSFSKLISLPRSLGKLSNLQELTGAIVTIGGAKSKHIFGLPQLQSFRQLRVLQIVLSSGLDAENHIDAVKWNKILSRLSNLEILDLDMDRLNDGSIMIDHLTPPEHLKELHLRNNHRSTLPCWVSPSGLKELQYLCIHDAPFVTEWIGPCNVKWVFLEGLFLQDMGNLSADWAEDMKEAMPALRYLEVNGCHRLRNLPAMN